MKILLLLLLISCAEEKRRGIPVLPSEERQLDRLETDLPYSQKIDVMVAFLWPVRIETAIQKQAVRDLINGSRSLKDLQDGYFRKKIELRRSWVKKDCDCVLNSLCTGEIPDTPFDECVSLEEQTFANERELPAIYSIVEKMKESVKISGGEWLETHTDFPEGPVSEMDFDRGILRLPVFAGIQDQYPEIPYSLSRGRTYDTFYAEFTDPGKRGNWIFDMSIQRSTEALKFQGKLFLRHQNTEREGIIYWMNPVEI